jgi:O-antigen ligase
MNAKSPKITPVVGADAGGQATASSPQSHLGLLALYEVAVLVVVLCLVYLGIPNYIYAKNEGFLPKYFYYAFFVALAPLPILRFRLLLSYVTSPFSLWALALIMLYIAHLMVALTDGDQSRADLIGTRIQYAVLAVALGFACSITRTTSYEHIFPFLAVLTSTTVIVDFLLPGVFYPLGSEGTVLGRAAATFFNPTVAGEAMLLTFVLAIPVVRPRYRPVLLFLVGAGVIVTFSRAAILGWMLLWLCLLLRKSVPKYTLVVPLVALAALPLLGSFESYLEGREDLSAGLDNLLRRLEFFQDQVLDDDSALERAQVLEAGLALFLEHPIVGAGAGTTDLWSLRGSTHNQPVMLAAEYGVLGIALWLWLAVILWKGKYFQDRTFQLISLTGFIFLSMFSHNIFDQVYWLMTFALVSGQRRP